jgi:hypothetical protein
MPRMIDLVRKSQMSSNMMQAAARGALAVQAGEMIEILVHLALHNKVVGDLARMTLAGWDEKASFGVARDPATSKEVLQYLISPRNIRPPLLPALLENPSITDQELAELAASGSRDVVEAMLVSKRVSESPFLIAALRTNPRLRANELAELNAPKAEEKTPPEVPSVVPAESPGAAAQPADAESALAEQHSDEPPALTVTEAEDEQVLAQAIAYYLQANAAELATQHDQPFEAVPASTEGLEGGGAASEGGGAAAQTQPHGAAAPETYASLAAKHAKMLGQADRRDSALQKIAKLDVKGRIALAMRGGKEERTILIRDGTKLVALAVLDSPKISDGEVEKIALQKNVLEAVLRAIPMKRRFAKNYTIMRNLVFNPRTPIDLSLGLMKNLLVHDLKNLSGNKEVSETIRKLALRMFKQKTLKKD